VIETDEEKARRTRERDDALDALIASYARPQRAARVEAALVEVLAALDEDDTRFADESRVSLALDEARRLLAKKEDGK